MSTHFSGGYGAMPKGEPGLYVEYCAKDFLDGTQMLDPWEELAYRRICDMIYVTNDRLADDDRKLAWATKTGRRWQTIKKTLTGGDKPKLMIVDGRVTNARCQSSLQKAAQKMDQKSRAGAASAASGKSLKNLQQHRTDDRRPVLTGDRTNHLTTEAEKEKGSLTGAEKERRATRLTADFEVPAEWIAAGAEARVNADLPPADLATEALKFVNHFVGSNKPNATKRDWRRTWVNWALNAKGCSGGRSQRKGAVDNLIEGFGRAAGLGGPADSGSDWEALGPLLDGEHVRFDA